MINSKTERASYVFTIKEYSDGTPWIMFEPSDENLESIGQGFLGFDFRDDVSFEEAQKIAELLRNKISSVSFTTLNK